jgi:hypothetical protein
MIPETIAARSGAATLGERKVFEALRDNLPEEYLVYYNISVKGRYRNWAGTLGRDVVKLFKKLGKPWHGISP